MLYGITLLVKEKAELLVEIEKRTKIESELMAEVEKLSKELQQERSKANDAKKAASQINILSCFSWNNFFFLFFRVTKSRIVCGVEDFPFSSPHSNPRKLSLICTLSKLLQRNCPIRCSKNLQVSLRAVVCISLFIVLSFVTVDTWNNN